MKYSELLEKVIGATASTGLAMGKIGLAEEIIHILDLAIKQLNDIPPEVFKGVKGLKNTVSKYLTEIIAEEKSTKVNITEEEIKTLQNYTVDSEWQNVTIKLPESERELLVWDGEFFGTGSYNPVLHEWQTVDKSMGEILFWCEIPYFPGVTNE